MDPDAALVERDGRESLEDRLHERLPLTAVRPVRSVDPVQQL
jgi:hypothetical protein